MTFKILSCDGGGIRGLITALLIKDLDDKYHVIAHADGFAGTSTGGLIALALANRVPISKLIDIYLNRASEVFKKFLIVSKDELDLSVIRPGANLELGGPGITFAEYVDDGLRDVAYELLGNALMSSAKAFVGVNSVRLWDPRIAGWVPVMISNSTITSNIYRDLTMVDAALATSAAPSYFPPHRVKSNSYDYGYFVDGGVFANNPSVSAIAEVLNQNPAIGLQDIRMLSLGTGNNPEGIPPASITSPQFWGAWNWLNPTSTPPFRLLNLALDATAELGEIQASQLLGRNYQRGNFKLPETYDLDDIDHLGKLVNWTRSYIASGEWQRICDWVEKNW